MPDKVRVAAIQMVSTPRVDDNLDSAAGLIAEAAAAGAKLVVLPEYWPIISDNDADKLACREALGSGPLQAFLSLNARKHAIWLIGGSIPLATDEDSKISSSCLLYDPKGQCIARYDKIHLFDVCVNPDRNELYRESDTITAGSRVVVGSCPFGNIGLSICYDLRFPELYRRMLDENISMIAVPSAFTTTTGERHWEMLLRTRAVENLSFVIAANQGGQHTAKRSTWGHSMIIDPWGEILASIDTGPGMICADLDLDRQQQLRQSFPALDHIKLFE
jgi:nitrilase